MPTDSGRDCLRSELLAPGRGISKKFYRASYGRVVAVVAAVLGDRHEAEEAAQEAFARALARWPRLCQYDLPEAWIRRVALRIAIDSGRRRRSAVSVSSRLRSLAARRAGEPEPTDSLALSATGRAMMRLRIARARSAGPALCRRLASAADSDRPRLACRLHGEGASRGRPASAGKQTQRRLRGGRPRCVTTICALSSTPGCGPIRDLSAPDFAVIRRRLRHRRARTAAACLVVVAVVPGVAVAGLLPAASPPA